MRAVRSYLCRSEVPPQLVSSWCLLAALSPILGCGSVGTAANGGGAGGAGPGERGAEGRRKERILESKRNGKKLSASTRSFEEAESGTTNRRETSANTECCRQKQHRTHTQKNNSTLEFGFLDKAGPQSLSHDCRLCLPHTHSDDFTRCSRSTSSTSDENKSPFGSGAENKSV